MLKTFWFWKSLLTYIVSVLMLTNAVASPFDVMELYGIEIPKQLVSDSEDGSEEQVHGSGIKAAVYALVASAFLFILLIPQDTKATESGKAVVVDSTIRFAAALAAFGAGWSWLAWETKGLHIQYTQAFGTVSGLYVLGLTVAVILAVLIVCAVLILFRFATQALPVLIQLTIGKLRGR